MQLLPSTQSESFFGDATSKSTKTSPKQSKQFKSVLSSLILKGKTKKGASNGTHTKEKESNKQTRIGSTLSSFIEEGRTSYTGVPVDAPIYGKEKGTVTRDEIKVLRKTLKEKGASETSIDCLNQLIASGIPMTVSKVFSVLEGTSRASQELTEEERKSFRSIMSKFGANREEIDSLLEASDKGDKKTLWNTLMSKSKEKQETIEITREEVISIVKGLDLSDETKSFIVKNFKDPDQKQLSLDTSQLTQMFSVAEKELVDRESAQSYIKNIMREAMVSSIGEAKIEKLSAPVEDLHGSIRQDQSKILMQDTVKKNNGFDELVESIGEGSKAYFTHETTDKNFSSIQENNKTKHTGKYLPEEKEYLSDRESDDPFKLSNSSLTFNNQHTDFKEENNEKKKNTSHKNEHFLSSKSTGTLRANKETEVTSKEKDSIPSIFSFSENQHLVDTQINGNKKDLGTITRQNQQEILQQVKSGVLQNTADGSYDIALELSNGDLGKINLILNIKEGEVKATIRTEHQESTVAIASQLDQLKEDLEKQGLKVADIEVRTGLQDNSSTGNQWNNQNEHNMMRDAQERDRLRQLANLRKEAGVSTINRIIEVDQQKVSQVGLHIVA